MDANRSRRSWWSRAISADRSEVKYSSERYTQKKPLMRQLSPARPVDAGDEGTMSSDWAAVGQGWWPIRRLCVSLSHLQAANRVPRTAPFEEESRSLPGN